MTDAVWFCLDIVHRKITPAGAQQIIRLLWYARGKANSADFSSFSPPVALSCLVPLAFQNMKMKNISTQQQNKYKQKQNKTNDASVLYAITPPPPNVMPPKYATIQTFHVWSITCTWTTIFYYDCYPLPLEKILPCVVTTTPLPPPLPPPFRMQRFCEAFKPTYRRVNRLTPACQ